MSVYNNVTFIESKGWTYRSKCACNPPWSSYRNDLLPGKEIRLHSNMFQLREGMNPLQMRHIIQSAGDISDVYTRYFDKENATNG